MPSSTRRAIRNVTVGLLASTALHAGAFLITHDEAAFLAMYGNPTETINFTKLVDGRTFSDAKDIYSPYVRSITQSPLYYMIAANGWSSSVSIGSADPGCLCAWQAVIWTDPGVVGSMVYGHLYLEVARPNTVIALNSGSDFIGLIPDIGDNSFFLAPGGLSLLRLGFSPIQPEVRDVPEPPSTPLIAGALLAAAGVTVRRRRQVVPLAICRASGSIAPIHK